MSTNKNLRRIAAVTAGVGGGIAATTYLVRHLMRRPLPDEEETITLSGLRHPVEVIRDQWGVPHIYAQTNEDLFFAQGYVHAQDRLFQMDVNRRVGSGRLSEIVGPAAIESDRFARTFAWPRAAQAQVDGIMKDEETRTIAAAYAAGVNAYIEHGELPLEYILLACRPEPWRPLDSALWGTVLAWGLSVNWQTELLRARLVEELGPERAYDLTPGYSEDYPAVVPGATVGTRLAQALLEAYRQAMDELPLGDIPSGNGVGSNNWVVNGQWTESGRPILANDPHLPPIFPTLWYENHLVGGDYNVTGFTMVGVPGVIIGHNEHIAWGITNSFADLQDIYVERFHPQNPLLYEVNGEWREAEEETTTIHVRGRRKPLVEKIRFTRHGPVISGLIPGEHRALSLRWSCYEENNHLRSLLQICRATDWQSFHSALDDWAFPPQNLVYADVQGNIGYAMPGRVPQRAAGSGMLPVPGWTDQYEWQGWIPADELPVSFNPQQGYIVTANNRVEGDGYPQLLTGEWQPPYRARRIADLLGELAPLDVASNGRIQNDTVSLLLLRFVRATLEGVERSQITAEAQSLLQRLASWGGEMSVTSTEATVAHGWMVNLLHDVLNLTIGAELAGELLGSSSIEGFPSNPFHEIGYELIIRWLESGPPGWVGEISHLLAPALQKTLDTLHDLLGPEPEQWQWGQLHYVELNNHLARIPGVGRLWRPVSFPLAGDGYTVSQAETAPVFPPDPVHIIASCRMVLDVGDWDNSISTLPGGQSGHPASHHYQDSVEDWLQGRYHPMIYSREKVEATVECRLTLEPAVVDVDTDSF